MRLVFGYILRNLNEVYSEMLEEIVFFSFLMWFSRGFIIWTRIYSFGNRRVSLIFHSSWLYLASSSFCSISKSKLLYKR